MSTIVRLGPEYFPDPTKGMPISSGSIYIGEPDLDPEVVSNQIQVSAVQESGVSVSISQPISTSAGGVPLYNGSPVTLTVEVSYSLKLLDSQGSQVYYVANSSVQDVSELLFLSNYGCDLSLAVADIGATSTTLIVDCAAIITSGTTVTIPDTLLFDIPKDSSIDGVAGGGTETLAFSGLDPTAGKYQVFGENVTVTGIRSRVPEWWGIDGVSDEVEIQKAIDCYAGGAVVLSVDGYTFTSAGVTLSNIDTYFGCPIGKNCAITTAADIDAVTISARTNYENVQLLQTGTSTKAGLKLIDGAKNCAIKNPWVQSFFHNYALESSTGTGVGYNNFSHAYSFSDVEGGTELYMEETGSGWVNANTFDKECNFHTNTGGAGGNSAITVGQNVFNGTSFENATDDPSFFAIEESGVNEFVGIRMEMAKINGIRVNNGSANQTRMTSVMVGHWDVGYEDLVCVGGRVKTNLYSGQITFDGYITAGSTGSTTVDLSSAAGQQNVNLTATTGFYRGSAVVMDEGNAGEEWGTVSSVTAGNYITLVSNLKNTHAPGVTVTTEGRAHGILGRPIGETYKNEEWAYGRPVRTISGQTDGVSEMDLLGGRVTAIGGVTTISLDTNVSNPPTDNQIDAAFGTAVNRGDGYVGFIDDAGTGTSVYLIVSNGTNWFHTLMTKAL